MGGMLAPRPAAPVVTGLGAVSAAGVGRGALWEAVSTGRVCTAPVSRFDVSGYPARMAGEVPSSALAALDSAVPVHACLAARYLAAAVREACEHAELALHETSSRVGVFVGTVMGTRPILDRGIGPGRLTVAGTDWAEPERLLDLIAAAAVNGPMVLIASGCSAGNDALSRGAAAIGADEVDVAICGGADELSQEVFALFASMRILAPDVVRPFDVNRQGMQPAEGSAVVIIESPEHLAARGGRALATLLGHASGADAYHLTRPRPNGSALTDVARDCIQRSGLVADDVDWVCAHGTGTRSGDGAEARAIANAFGAASRRPAVSSIKAVLGHAQGAAAALEAVVAVQALNAQLIPGNATLQRPDECCSGIDLVEPAGRRWPVRTVLSLAFGLGGGICAVMLGRAGAVGHVR